MFMSAIEPLLPLYFVFLLLAMLLSKWYVSEAVDAYGTACTCRDVDTTPALGILHTLQKLARSYIQYHSARCTHMTIIPQTCVSRIQVIYTDITSPPLYSMHSDQSNRVEQVHE